MRDLKNFFYTQEDSMSKKLNPRLRDEPPPPPLSAEEAKDRAVFIRQEITKVTVLKRQGKSFDELKEAAPEFANNYPHLFIMVTSEDGYDETTLHTMLVMLDQMASNKTTQHDASVVVGKRLASQYMKDINDGSQTPK
jgi:hypothetical protein